MLVGRLRAQNASSIVKFALKRIALPVVAFGPIAFFFPKLALFYAVCGLYDVARHKPVTGETVRKYFLGNGIPTWLLSPFNILMDLLTLPFINKGVYRLEDLPPAYREEVTRLIEISRKEDLVRQLEERSKDFPRTMVFFKWYGVNVDTFLNVPGFHADWKYIQTIGVSIFNKKASTSKHYGPTRVTLRVLYNLNDMDDHSAYIVVGDTTSYWREDKLFIFDDTLMHQSFNESDKPRYCMFVDILRPSYMPSVLRGFVTGTRLLTRSFNRIFYQNWKIIER
jgi:beta-hydroxylase